MSSSLPLSILPLSHPHYLSPSFLSVILTSSPSFIPFNPPPHYLFSFNEKERSSEEEVIRMMMMRTEEKSIRRR
jgi:hypothetical protein